MLVKKKCLFNKNPIPSSVAYIEYIASDDIDLEGRVQFIIMMKKPGNRF